MGIIIQFNDLTVFGFYVVHIRTQTIQQITASAAFSGEAEDARIPNPQELVDNIRDRLRHRCLRAETELRRFRYDCPEKEEVKKRLDRVRQKQEHFENMLETVPDGFKLVPVFYKPVSEGANAGVQSEYKTFVRSRFLQFLGENHADALRQLGIPDCGISRMKNGMDPTDDQGRGYELNVDHIVERGGCGLWAQMKSKDPDAHPNAPVRHPVNHFGNLILLPEQIHAFKNELNEIQRTGLNNPHLGRWMLMMIPEFSAANAGFVCPPQSPSHPLAGLRLRADDVYSSVGYAAKTTEFAAAKVVAFLDNAKVKSAVAQFTRAANDNRGLADIARDQALQNNGHSKLRTDFATAIADEARAVNYRDEILRPALYDAGLSLQRLFHAAALKAAQNDKKAFDYFITYYHSDGMTQLRESAATLPLEESSEFLKICRDIDRKITCILAQKSKRELPPAA
jgi:hypothetical protein